MTRAFGYLFAEQCRTVAGLAVLLWGGLGVAALVAEWMAGSPFDFRASHLVAVQTLVLPTALAVVLPLATGLVVLRLHEKGELAALWVCGRGPLFAAFALLLPLLPCALIFYQAVHWARPAAFAGLATAALQQPFDLEAALARVSSTQLGVAAGPEQTRLLLDLGPRALALEVKGGLGDALAGDSSQKVGPGRFHLVELDALAERGTSIDSSSRLLTPHGQFSRAELVVFGLSRSLERARLRELSSKFLATNQSLWARLRSPDRVRDASLAAAKELAEREWMVIALILATGLVLWPLWWRSVPQPALLLGGIVLPALCTALLLPRWLA